MECYFLRKVKSWSSSAPPAIGISYASAEASVTSFKRPASFRISPSRKTSLSFPRWKNGTAAARRLVSVNSLYLWGLSQLNLRTAAPANFLAASASAWALPALLPPIPRFCSWTSHSARSIPSRAPSCSVNSAPSPAASAKPSSSSLTTCAKLCCSLRVSSCSKLAASWPWLRLRNFSVSSIPKFAPLLLLWKPLPEPPHESRPEQFVLLHRAPRRNRQRHTRSYGSCRHRHDHRYSHWCPAGNVHRAAPHASRDRISRCQHLSNRS